MSRLSGKVCNKCSIRCKRYDSLLKVSIVTTIIVFLAATALHIWGRDLPNFMLLADSSYFLIALAAFACAFIGYKHSPKEWQWKYFAIGLGLWTVAELIWLIYENAFGMIDPWPSLADAFWVVGYVPFAIGLIARMKNTNPRDILNKFFMSLAGGTSSAIALVFVFHAHIFPEGTSIFEGILAMAYPIADLVLFALALMLLYGTIKYAKTEPKCHIKARGFLALSLFMFATFDFIFSQFMISEQTLLDAYSIIYVGAYLCFALAGYSCAQSCS